ncbi:MULTISPECIES: aldehyde dehydrogenase family protein [Agrobacterium]|uniref:aldehyde dehydrogenase family protein n=1 Tax=Agrobacterium TaxID=357 RepID=UPI0017AB2FFA|nr:MULTISPECIES: aldehyde dehydrogenase family protein [Agrobacterium]MBA4774979.1 aldehyde dehydrogenase family protein [Hyphomicrobiales bacterium]MCZ7888623.1 aldehyde dehydrogenase family protein [Agrobacterium salinitolerans]MDA5630910.1 aldehyde dehydrogenase family protein [Agrobacterium sp. ST15.16.055]MDA5640070.1 aldehyde dehydrogenase family protein [Agrobacterium sp. ST15.13.013]MDA6981796.1 aldehyde dehydrogenase family protein [Agrobacterium salinitolerans]
MKRENQFYINGEWQAFADVNLLPVVDPASEQVTGHVPAGSARHVDLAVAAARKAFPSFAQSSIPERLALLKRMHALVMERAELFAQAIVSEMGTPISFARSSQVFFAAEHIRVQMETLETYPFLSVNGGLATAKEAIGVCALITPWNWPLYQITAKVAPAIAAGCTIVLKPSELSPYSAVLFAELMHDAGTSPGVFNLVNGTGEAVGAALSSHPDVDMISITGSTRAGVLVAQAAAPTIKRVVQELGGKSPNILLDDADFEIAVPKGLQAGMRNAGQSCSAPTRMLVPAHRLSQVEELARNTVHAMVVGDPRDAATTMGPIANRAQFERVQTMIRAGIDGGAKLVAGGPGRPGGIESGFFAQPTVFSDVTPDMRIAREEIFGPVLAIMPYKDEEEAITIANDTVYGLGAHVQSGDIDRARRVASRIRAGQVHINYPAWNGAAAFGGYKQSGNGREYGVHGLEEYLETKSILGY